jgi:Kyakuja-Dileera-Zisupton transposase
MMKLSTTMDLQMVVMLLMVIVLRMNVLSNGPVNICAKLALCALVERIFTTLAQCVFLVIVISCCAVLNISSADVIACLDACFTQKRRHGPEDPPHSHPQSVFLSSDEIKAMEDFVGEQRPSRPRTTNPDEDGFEPSMKVPTSVLNECGESFRAADERRAKASTQFFADTGLMALLCRHDRVLWLANMTSAGERQYYALALINKLFTHLPPAITVGLLYDIGCQLHRSCAKWGFLPDFMDRITFGISVFHAYGHQWPCQLIYHPRKCAGFGLSDGEGCERFWSFIKSLIPSLRVSGVSFHIFFCCNHSSSDIYI